MFLEATLKRNLKLIDAAFKLHSEGLVEPDTYILDLDVIINNAKEIKKEADKHAIKLYFMTKQFGRNPYVSSELMKLGYEGAVAVDFREAEILASNSIALGHVGHLVQIPKNKIEAVLKAKPQYITVYSIEKAQEVSEAAVKLGVTQKIMIRVIDKGDMLYPAQYGGFYIEELLKKAKELIKLPNLILSGITSFPCFLYNESEGYIKETNNAYTLQKAKKVLEENLNIEIEQVNMPSASCACNVKNISNLGGTHGEPGHGLLGTTPIHAASEQPEIPAIVYVSEISHNLDNKSFCYGGGHYRRSHMENALVGKTLVDALKYKVEAPEVESIDYHFTLSDKAEVSDTVVMAFRTQIFVTRSKVAVVRGIQSGRPQIVGIYDSQGMFLE
ncbi:YhfX family PLP-dependent enzyme [Clostridium swellfunianum]|uniref:YhfX family PLP-dependent enzyme n=1 Tax=Clostridium swellfunianum TaxID=1367462 RepID=UPI0020308DC1|nr:YhfX family PLP-dependent enzyme [Clostridium swellfunianum]MCM0649740.1 YhfX family PLP-dependent enzyme [Clostridium swellfunianum]